MPRSTGRLMRCDRCSRQLGLATKTCPHCGARLAAPALGEGFNARAVLPNGVEPQDAVAALVAMAYDRRQSHTTRRSVALLLGEVEDSAGEVVDALVHLLDADSDRTRLCAMAALRRLGPAARGAAPALVRLLTVEGRTLRGAAVGTLRAIDPGAPVPASVVADLLEQTETSLQHAFDVASSGTAFLDVRGKLIRSNVVFRSITQSIGVDLYRPILGQLVEAGLIRGLTEWTRLTDGSQATISAETRVPPEDPLGRCVTLRGS